MEMFSPLPISCIPTLLSQRYLETKVSWWDVSTNVSEPTINGVIIKFPTTAALPNGIFTLNSQSAKGEIYIYNLLGEVIYKSKMNSSVSRIDLSEHANGIYFVRVISGSEIYSGKLLKQ